MVGIYRKPNSPAITYGIIRDKKRYFLGARIDDDVNFESVEWRNDLFELCDGLRRDEAGGTLLKIVNLQLKVRADYATFLE